MRFTICFLMLVSGFAVGFAQDKASAKKDPQPAAPAAKRDPQVIPAEAKEVSPNMWRYVDKDGKVWMYRRTPFGVMKAEELKGDEPNTPFGTSKAPDSKSGWEMRLRATTAVEEGDSIRFTRPGPFGNYGWTRKKSELTEDEQAIWNREKQKKAAVKPNEKE